jgi:acylphosphatase
VADDIVRARAVVHGRVQGVWFRQSTAEHARALGVSGWVRNLPDGGVEAVFEGAPGAVDQSLGFVRTGRAGVHGLRLSAYLASFVLSK